MELPFCVPSKRARAPNNGNQIASCLVDGCDSDLSKCRDYHRRHKVCELHSKTPKVTIRGQEQRFCQQCSRFHSLVEFDDVKRSCRKRLDGHNRRRRKPQPDSSLNSTQFLSNFQAGAKFVPFTGSQAFTGSALASCSWASPVKPENNVEFFSSSHQTSLSFNDRKALFSVSSPQSFKGHIQSPFLQVTKQGALGGPSIGGPIADPNRSPGINGGCSQKLFLGAVSPDRALSLLSSLPQAEASPQKGMSRALLLDPSPPIQSVLQVQHPHYDRIGLCESEPRALASQEMFQMRHGGPTASTSHQSHHHAPSFFWE